MDTYTVRLQRPEDLLAAVPFQLGFHPTRSLVVIAFTGRRLLVTARIDLPEPERLEHDVAGLVRPLAAQDCDSALVAGYEDEPGDATDGVRALRARLRDADIHVTHTMVVRGDRWSECGTGRRGRIPYDHPALAPYVLLGRAPLADRAAQTRLVEHDGSGAGIADAVRSLQSRRRSRARRREPRLWRVLLDPSPGAIDVADLTDREVARLVCALSDVHWRDGLVMRASPHVHPMTGLPGGVVADAELVFGSGRSAPVDTMDTDDRRLARLQALARRVPDTCADEVAELCALIGSFAWANGAGAAAGDAVHRALRVRPQHRLASLVQQLLAGGVRPPARVAEAG